MKDILIASDHAGFALKEKLKSYLCSRGIEVRDLGAYSKESCDYPLYAYALAKAVSSGKYRRGILICKSGIGSSIVANKLKRVRAGLCYNLKSAKLSRMHNDSNVLVLGAAFVSAPYAAKIVSAWLNTAFEGGRHARRVKQISAIEKKIRSGLK